MSETKKVRVWLRVEVPCLVEVSAPNEDGQAEVHGIEVYQPGNMAVEVATDIAALSEDDFDAIDAAAQKAFE